MKIALLSDIHGNSVALEAVLESVKGYKISDVIVLGDFVGYYYQPDTVLRMLAEFRTTFIRGNHEVMLGHLRDRQLAAEQVKNKYGSGVSIALTKLSTEQINMLVQLPDSRRVEIDGVSLTLCHGSPFDPNVYVYPDASNELLEKCASAVNTDFLFLGHTHYPFIRSINGVVIVNPGSVGQPRDQSFGASWAIINTANKSVVFKQTPYSTDDIIKEVDNIDPDLVFLKEVLTRKPR